jgi:hypothetical protein
MKLLPVILCVFIATHVCGQDYPFANSFVAGKIILKDGTQENGQIKWFPDQNEKLKFREHEHDAIKKFSPEDLLGFTVDSVKYVPLFNFEVFAEEYALLGKLTKIKHIFGQLLDSGSFNIYFVMLSGYNALSGSIQPYPNFLFERKSDGMNQYAAFPFAMRMKSKKYEKAKETLYNFFRDYHSIIDKLKACKQTDDFFAVINLMKTLN